MNFKKIFKLLVVCSISTLLFSGCTTHEAEASVDTGKVTVVATLFPQYDFVRQIGKDKVEVSLLLPPGMESHSFEPTPADIIDINNSDLFIYTGDTMEPWAKNIINGIDENSSVSVIETSKNITLERQKEPIVAHSHEHDENQQSEIASDDHQHIYDPHIWTSPINAITMVDTITENLIAIDPENTDFYTQNSLAYKKELIKIDDGFNSVLENSSHNEMIFGGRFPFQYFVSTYDIDYMSAFESCSSESEPSVKTLVNIIDYVNEHDIPVIYHEELVNPTIAESISEETGAKLLLFHSCHNVSKDEFESGVTYVSLMEQNIKNLREGLI